MFDKLKQSIKKAFSILGKHEEDEVEQTKEKERQKEKKKTRESKKEKQDKKARTEKEAKKKKKGKESSKQKKDKEKKVKSEKKAERQDSEKEVIVTIEKTKRDEGAYALQEETQEETEVVQEREIQEEKKKPKFSEKEFEALFEEFELLLLEANVALEAIEKLKQELKNALLNKKGKLKKIFEDTFVEVIDEIIRLPKIDVLDWANKHKPLKILFMGVNGSGKTTSMAKLAKFFLNHNKTVVFAAADTFRAASIEQLQHHAKVLGIKVIAHQYGSDPTAVAYDAVRYAESHGIDVVLIDSAGRLHTNINLMKELEKIKRVIKPELTFLVVDALTGHDAIDQAIEFGKVGFDGIILTKYDADDKGGVVISLCEITKKPIVFIGTGQNYDDLEYFDADKYLDELFGGEE